jgi:hypothetical protein
MTAESFRDRGGSPERSRLGECSLGEPVEF